MPQRRHTLGSRDTRVFEVRSRGMWLYFRRRPFVGGLYLIGVSRWQPGRAPWPPEEEYHVMPRPPVEGVAAAAAPATAAKHGKYLLSYPELRGYLLDLCYEGTGQPRVPSWLMIRPGAGHWTVTLKDPQERRLLRVMVEKEDMAFAALEALLTLPVVPWEVDQYAQELPGRRGKKK